MQAPDEAFLCAITKAVMRDPVVDREGYSYERSAIEKWIRENGTNPMTRKPMKIEDLKPNRALKEAILNSSKRRKTADDAATKTSSSAAPSSDFGSLTVEKVGDDDRTFIYTFSPHEIPNPIPTDVVVVVDTSGSMNADAAVQNAKGEKESHGLSVLDIVKHAAKTIVHTLGSDDRFALVEFNAAARVVCEPMTMSGSNRTAALAAISSLKAGGRTNLWGGLDAALRTLTLPNPPRKRNTAVMLLTDGVPNIVPPRGHLTMLQKFAKQFDDDQLPCRIFTFGFGYELDSQLLFDIASAGAGTFGFIPDAAMVGTIFVNAISNIRSLVASNGEVKIRVPRGNLVEHVFGSEEDAVTRSRRAKSVASASFPATETNVSLNLGIIQSGQSRSVAVRFARKVDDAAASMSAQSIATSTKVSKTASTSRASSSSFVEISRLELVDALRACVELVPAGRAPRSDEETASIKRLGGLASKLDACAAKASDLSRSDEDALSGMSTDIKGQLTLAVSAEHYQRWGRHYILSTIHAHTRQFCHNFKDKGVSRYGGALFQSLRDKADDIFCALPPPTPSVTRSRPSVSRSLSRGGGRGGGGSGPPLLPTPPVSMRTTYYNTNTPCFDGRCEVLMADGTLKCVKDIVPGDRVRSSNSGDAACVDWVVRTRIESGYAPNLVELNQGRLRITEYHPVYDGKRWVFPKDSSLRSSERSDKTRCDAIYSFVLEAPSQGKEPPSLTIGGVRCASLGHGDVDSDSVHAHPYFGSRVRVLQDLQKMTPHGTVWPLSNIVELSDRTSTMLRDPVTGDVCGMMQ